MGAKAGIFEQYAGNMGDEFKKSWTGGELSPGLGISDTSKMFEKRLGGISGKNITQKAVNYGVAAQLGGLATGLSAPRRFLQESRAGFRGTGARVAKVIGDETAFPKAQAQINQQQSEQEQSKAEAKK